MRVAFFGTPAFAVPSLVALRSAGIDVVAVITQPDRPNGRSHSTLIAPPVKQSAAALNLAVHQPDRPRGDLFYNFVRSLDIDLGVVVAYGHLLKPELLAIPRLGFVNVHASLLPRWRGAAPIQWSILAGDHETGVAIMRIEEGLDTGAVWHVRETAISDDDTAGSLTHRLAELGAEALLEALPSITDGKAPAPQGDAGATHAAKVNRDLARIQWDVAARAVSCRFRAMDPAPGAWTTLGATEIKLTGGRAIALSEPALPGTILERGESILVATADGAVTLDTVQPAGKRRVTAREWYRGAALVEGARFL